MTTGKTIALTRQTFVGKIMPLLFNMLSRVAWGGYSPQGCKTVGHNLVTRTRYITLDDNNNSYLHRVLRVIQVKNLLLDVIGTQQI